MAFSMKLPADKKGVQVSTSGSSGSKQYGLILPTKKNTKKELTPASVFAVTIEDDAPLNTPNDKASERRRVGAEAARSLQRAQVERTHEKALAEDASVFDYDGVYDDIQRSRDNKKRERKAQRENEKQNSKYISTLLEKAKIREIEHERIYERRLLKERATEDALYGDKEKLVSASYKRKLQDMKRWDEEDRRLDELEAAEDVTKRGGDAMAGFYSNLLTKNLAMGGAATNARSAYTIGRGDTATQAPTTIEDEKRESRRSTEEVYRKSGRDVSPEAKKARVEDEKREDRRPRAPAETVTVAATSGPSKEETISAARARFLARKAARQQSEATSQ